MVATAAPDTWGRGDPYEEYVGRWSRVIAPLFLSWLKIPPGRRWLDVGCGTGALGAAILAQCSPSWVAGVEPSEGFLHKAREQLGDRAMLSRGTAAGIPLDGESVDVVVSGLVLNFVPDCAAALAEMERVTRRGGTIGAYVWDYAGRMDLMRIFWETAAEIDPAAAELDEGTRFPICRPDALAELFARPGLRDPSVTAIEIPMAFADFEDYWRPFLGGQGPAPGYAMALDEKRRSLLRDRIRERLPMQRDGSIALAARAWAVRATVRA